MAVSDLLLQFYIIVSNFCSPKPRKRKKRPGGGGGGGVGMLTPHHGYKLLGRPQLRSNSGNGGGGRASRKKKVRFLTSHFLQILH